MDLSSLGPAGFAGTAYIDDYRFGGGLTGGIAHNSTGPESKPSGNVSAFESLLAKPDHAGSKTVTIDKTDKLYEQCLELEIFMVKTLVSSMRDTVQKSGLINEGFAGKMYEDMLYDEYARDLTKNAGFGMADMAYLELSGQRSKVVIR